MVAKRGLSNQANVHTPMWKCSKHSKAEFQSIQQFWLQLDIVSQHKKYKYKCRRGGSEATHSETRNRRLFLVLFALCTKSPSLNESEAYMHEWRHSSTMSHCCVHQCVNDSRYSDELSIHNFPKDKPSRKIWIRKTNYWIFIFGKHGGLFLLFLYVWPRFRLAAILPGKGRIGLRLTLSLI